jgi:hypothetical protein
MGELNGTVMAGRTGRRIEPGQAIQDLISIQAGDGDIQGVWEPFCWVSVQDETVYLREQQCLKPVS